MSTTSAGSPAAEPTKGNTTQSKEAALSAEAHTYSIQEIQEAAKKVIEQLAPEKFSTFYEAREKAEEKALHGKTKPEGLEPEITHLYFSAADVIRFMRVCQGVTWKIKDDAERTLQTKWALLGTSTPDTTHTIPFTCLPAPTGGEGKLLSFTIV
jgi:hypothetical protein